MISVNDSHVNKEMSINDDGKIMIEEIKEIPPMDIDIKNQEEPVATVSSDEANTMYTEDEKHDISSSSESEMKGDDETDAQPLFEQPVILDGKRSRRPTSRLEISELTPTKKELLIPQGHGKPLGEIEYINYQITHASTDALFRLRTICFGRRGNKSTIRKHLREFKGFDFARTSDEYQRHLNNLIKFKKDQLKSITNILGLPATGRNNDHAERILNFLMKPIDEGKKVPGKKSTGRTPKKRSKDSTETDHETKTEKPVDKEEQHNTNYVYKPGKLSSDKRSSNDQTPNSAKRKKRTPAVSESKENHEINTLIDEYKRCNEETIKFNENDAIDNKLIEKSEVKTDEIIQDAN